LAQDAQGRTALDWATSRAQLNDMELLIASGSNLNTMDVTGRTAVLHAVDSHNDQALRMVLEAGANPNPQMPDGVFRSSPVTAASFGGLARMIELLIQFKAKIDVGNPEGRTALQTVAVTGNVECAAILLRYGADMNHMSSNGYTPLMTTIMHNKHAMLAVFLPYYTGPQWDSQLLPTIRQCADPRTMSILTRNWGPYKADEELLG
jgi:ankyrin repeat protein